MLCLVEQPQRGVPGRVRADGHHVLQLLQAVAQVRAAVLLKLVVGGPGGGGEEEDSYQKKPSHFPTNDMNIGATRGGSGARADMINSDPG